MVGRTLLHYRILSPLGSGGMGEVYAAEDTKLHRKIALKVLPAALAGDAERLARFQREAFAIAALNHPNVITIYSVEEDAGQHFLTMELVNGATVASRIPRGGLSIADVLRIAVPLVDAVSAAHQAGIVHRDLKPSNVMLTQDGRVKVLDFGLAKLRPEPAALTAMSTMAAGLTEPHQVFGTAAYMSPEQAEGRIVDQRSDIFSLGVILYEMLTGGRPFTGASSVAIISSILRDSPPPISQARPDAPDDLDRIVRRCLSKDVQRRYQTALDLKIDLEDVQAALTSVAAPPARASRSRVVVAVVALVALAATGYVALDQLRHRFGEDAAPEATFAPLTSAPAAELYSSLSPDAKWIVYAGESAGNRDIYLQSTSGETAINLTKDSVVDDEQPAFSPDGERIAFRSARDGGGLFVMGRTGEGVRRVTRQGYNPAWSPDGKSLVFTSISMEFRPQNSTGRSELWIGTVDGSTPPHKIYDGDATMPSWSPDGQRIAFNQALTVGSHVSVMTIPIAGGEPTRVEGVDEEIAWNPVWSPDGRYLYFISNRGGSPNIWRLAIDQVSGTVLSAPQPITTPAAVVAHLSISADGKRLSYSAIAETQNVQRLPFDPIKGEAIGDAVNLTTGSRFWGNPDPSPDGSEVVFYSQVQPEGDLYVIKSDGTGLRQLTSDKAIDRVPRWSPDGKWIAAFSDRDSHLQIWKIRPDGSDLTKVTGRGEWAYNVWAPNSSRFASAIVVNKVSSEAQRTFAIFNAGQSSEQQGEVIQLPDQEHFVPNDWAADGHAIVGQASISTPAIELFTLADKSLRRVLDFGEWPSWLPDSRRVLFVSKRREFHVLDTVTMRTRMVYSTPRDTLGPPRLTRDGRSAYFSRRVTEADIWLADLK
jgi:Tol biopolymer transport system component